MSSPVLDGFSTEAIVPNGTRICIQVPMKFVTVWMITAMDRLMKVLVSHLPITGIGMEMDTVLIGILLTLVIQWILHIH